MKTKGRKQKGRALQKWVCSKIADLFHIPYDQQDDGCLVQSRGMGQKGVDIILRGKLRKKFPYAIECKNTEKINLYAAIDQAKLNCEDDQDWLVVHKKNYSNPIVIMDWSVFEKLIK